MITIGPWWIYDLILLALLVWTIIGGVKKGFWVTFYFLAYEIIVVIIISFIPQLIVNGLNDAFYKLLVKMGFGELASRASPSLSGFFTSLLEPILGKGKVPDMNVTGVIDSGIRAVTAMMLYAIISLSFIIVLNIVMFIIYAFIRQKLKLMKINKTIDLIIGATVGFFFGMMFVGMFSTILSSPIFDYGTQKLLSNPIDPNIKDQSEIRIDRIKNGNQYKKYAITSRVISFIPPVPVSYSAMCVAKYAIEPGMAVVSTITDKNSSISINERMMEVSASFEDTFVEGLASNSFLNLSLKSCINTMPNDSKALTRFVVEGLLASSHYTSSIIQPKAASLFETKKAPQGIVQTKAQAMTLFDRLDSFKTYYHFDRKLSESDFIDYFAWEEKQSGGKLNQFIIAANELSRKNKNSEIIKVLKNPSRLWTMLKNMFELNMNYQAEGVMTFFPNIYMTQHVMNGLEIAPSGILSNTFGYSSVNGEEMLYNFQLKLYFDYVKEQNEKNRHRHS